jgi:hypothetical protein
MTGILLIGVAIAWMVVVLFLTRWAISSIKLVPLKIVCGLTLPLVLLAAPLTDELIGKQQFDSLCRKYAVQTIDEQHAMNRRVSFERPAGAEYAKGTAVRIRIDPYTYRDEETKKILISFHILTAQGGWLVRALGISETSAPLIFRSACAPNDAFGFQKTFNITVVN